ncbi:MAG: hypothetical protein K5883_06740 [Pseudobutyrivibrio sp.]|nr:hypothetical protein [Pseudobutyrivibrio sp.]
MNRKISCMFGCIVASIIFVGCSKTVDLQGDNYECEDSDECVVCHVDGSEAQNLEESGLYIQVGDVDIKSSSDPKDILDKLGEPDDTFTYKFCGTQNDAYEYTYNDGVAFNTYPSDGKDYIECVTISSDKGQLSNGVKIGDTRDQVLEALGESTCYVENESDYYAYDNAEVTIWYTDDAVSSIYLYFYEP